MARPTDPDPQFVGLPTRVSGRSSGQPATQIEVVLIRPAVLTIPGSLSTHGPTPPVGLAYLAAVLREGGHAVTVIDAPGEGIDTIGTVATPIGPLQRRGLENTEIANRIPASATLVGLSLMFVHEWPEARELIAAIGAERPDVRIVIGGESATSYWQQMVTETSAIDFVVLGEGERTLLALADRLAAGATVQGIEGLVGCRGEDLSEPVGLPVRIRDLDEVPRPAWDLISLQAYFDHPYFGVNRGRSMPVLATRGCPYRCSFCSSPQMWTTRYVVRDPEDVVDEIASYVERYRITNVNFCDLTAITKRSWTLRFCDALEARGLDLTWQLPVGTRAEALDEVVLRRLHDTGCRNITYAPESGSPRMLEVFDKKVDLSHILSSLRSAHRVGLRTHVNIIIGHPAERWSDLAKSVRFLIRAAMAGCDDCAPIMFCPYPGSADYDALVAADKLEPGDASCYLGLARSSSHARTFNPSMSARQLRIAQVAMLATFYSAALVRRPLRATEFLWAQVSGREHTYLDQMVRSLRAARRTRRATVNPGGDL